VGSAAESVGDDHWSGRTFRAKSLSPAPSPGDNVEVGLGSLTILDGYVDSNEQCRTSADESAIRRPMLALADCLTVYCGLSAASPQEVSRRPTTTNRLMRQRARSKLYFIDYRRRPSTRR